MAFPRTNISVLFTLALGLVLLTMSGCKKPPVATGIGVPVTQNGVSVSVTDAKLIRPEFEGRRGAVVSESPVLKLSLQINNGSSSPLLYDLGWSQVVSTQPRSMLLFVGSDPETDVTLVNEISSIDLTDVSYPEDPVAEKKRIAVGTSLKDEILFEAPPEGVSKLLLSVPPHIFPDSDMPGYLVIPWTPNEVAPLPSVGFGELYEDDTYSMKVTKVEDVWVKLEDTSGEPGISKKPLLKITFKLTNKSEDPLSYRPTRERGAVAFPMLIEKNGSAVSRASFDSAVTVAGQKDMRKQVAPGESITDFMLFEQPAEGVDRIRFIYPGKRFGASGQARVDLDYTRTTPEKPAAWKQAAKESSEEE